VAAVFRPKSPSAARSANVTPGADTGPGSGFDPRTSGPVVFLHSATDDEGRADSFLHVVVVLAAHRVRASRSSVGHRRERQQHRGLVAGRQRLRKVCQSLRDRRHRPTQVMEFDLRF
jgi:hypothetical protein